MYKSQVNSGILLLFMSEFALCATPGWAHVELVGSEAERDFLISNGQCTKESRAAIQMPQSKPVAQQPQGYNVQGQVRTTSNSGFTANSQYNAQVNPQTDIAGMMASTRDTYNNSAAKANVQRDQHAGYVGCMAEKGWMTENK